ncbi:MAG: flavodoxin family protein [Candidatus Thorarchaeota archaeon]|jgi:NAD(P)H dehydrogenase (quinone)
MVKVMVVYESMYGNTKLVAEKIIEGMGETEGIETVLSEVKKVDLDYMADYDAILIGSPNHIGRPTRGITKFIDKLGKLGLKEKSAAVFDRCLRSDFENQSSGHKKVRS